MRSSVAICTCVLVCWHLILYRHLFSYILVLMEKMCKFFLKVVKINFKLKIYFQQFEHFLETFEINNFLRFFSGIQVINRTSHKLLVTKNKTHASAHKPYTSYIFQSDTPSQKLFAQKPRQRQLLFLSFLFSRKTRF